MSGFKYKGTDLNDMIGDVNKNSFITDATTTTTLSQYYSSLKDTSGPVSTTSIARLGTNTLYSIQSSGDIMNSVIAYYTNFDSLGPHSGNQIQIPPWATSCSIFIIGAGGSGAGGSQGFNPSPGQTKNSQQGRGGGGGGAGGIVACSSIDISQSSKQLSLFIGGGGSATNYDQAGYSGQSSHFSIKQGSQGTDQFYLEAQGAMGGTVGSSNGGPSGLGGVGGYYSYTGTAPNNIHPGQGKSGQDGAAGNVFNYCNGGNISTILNGTYIPQQIISNGGYYQQQITSNGQGVIFADSQGYGGGGAGGASGYQGGGNIQTPPNPTNGQGGQGGSNGGAGADGFVRIYWLNTA